MKLTNDLGMPEPFVHAFLALDKTYREGRATRRDDISVTSLIAPPLKVELGRRHDEDLTQDVADLIYAIDGSALHFVLAEASKAIPGAAHLAEERLYADFDGWVVSGAYDYVLMDRNNSASMFRLQDWKRVSVWEALGETKFEKVAQVNCLAELARRNGYGVPVSLQLVYVFRDWSKRKAALGQHPPKQVQIVDVPIWDSEKVSDFIRSRVAVHKAARELPDDKIPVCTREERWEDNPIWAVMREGRKSAVKLCQTREEAEELSVSLGKTHYIQERPSEPTRCLHYCSSAPVCPFMKSYRKEKE